MQRRAPLGAGDERHVDRARQASAWPAAGPRRPTRTSRPAISASRRSRRAGSSHARDGTSARVVGRAARDVSLERASATLAVAEHALGVGAVERQPGEELRRHAAAPARVVVPARRARAAALRLAQLGEQLGLAPDLREAAGLADVAGEELVVDRERAGVDVADRIDQADDPPGAAQVQARQRLAVGGEVEEASRRSARRRRAPSASRTARAAGRRSGCSSSQTSAPRPEGRSRVSRSCAPYSSAIALNASSCATFWRVITTEILNRPKPASASRSIARIAPSRSDPAPRTASLTSARRAVERDLHVDVVGGGEPRRDLRRDPDAVGRELDPDVVRCRVVDELPEVAAHRRLAAADVDVEDLHPLRARRSPPCTRRSSARAGRAGPSSTGSGRRRGCRRRSAPRSGRSARRGPPRSDRPAVARRGSWRDRLLTRPGSRSTIMPDARERLQRPA